MNDLDHGVAADAAALPPSWLSPYGSQAKPAAANANFTPGPWWVSNASGAFRIEAPDAEDPSEPWCVAVAAEFCGYSENQTPANARLIAAAPELYGALENILAVIEGEGGTKPNAREMCRAALAKARGEA